MSVKILLQLSPKVLIVGQPLGIWPKLCGKCRKISTLKNRQCKEQTVLRNVKYIFNNHFHFFSTKHMLPILCLTIWQPVTQSVLTIEMCHHLVCGLPGTAGICLWLVGGCLLLLCCTGNRSARAWTSHCLCTLAYHYQTATSSNVYHIWHTLRLLTCTFKQHLLNLTRFCFSQSSTLLWFNNICWALWTASLRIFTNLV